MSVEPNRVVAGVHEPRPSRASEKLRSKVSSHPNSNRHHAFSLQQPLAEILARPKPQLPHQLTGHQPVRRCSANAYEGGSTLRDRVARDLHVPHEWTEVFGFPLTKYA